jgi:hypothetical protein
LLVVRVYIFFSGQKYRMMGIDGKTEHKPGFLPLCWAVMTLLPGRSERGSAWLIVSLSREERGMPAKPALKAAEKLLPAAVPPQVWYPDVIGLFVWKFVEDKLIHMLPTS